MVYGLPVVCISHSSALCDSFTTEKNKTMHYHTFLFFVLHNIIKLNKLGVNSFSELEICAKDCGQLKDAKGTRYSFKIKDAK